MPRLFRPHIPLEVRCRVVLRQLGEMWPDKVIATYKWRKTKIILPSPRPGLKVLLTELLDKLADLLGCEVKELRLDHLPALALRKKVFRDGVHVDYEPPCDSPDDLIYRTHIAHLVKTNHHGDGAQHPDRVLIKRERRRIKGTKPKPKRKWATRKLQSRPMRNAKRKTQ